MRRILLLVTVGAVAAFAIWYGVRVAEKTSTTAVTVLLPRETIALVHVPDPNRTRHEWSQSDIYKIFSEPAVQDFLSKPLGKVPKTHAVSEILEEIAKLEPKDIFFAVTSMVNNNPKVLAGFRFRGSQGDAEKIIAKGRSGLLQKVPGATHETVQHEQHKIEVVTAPMFTLATVYSGQWLFAANDLEQLKALLDRADGRIKDASETLDHEETFRAASAQMPTSYAALFYLQPKILADKIATLRAALGHSVTPDQHTFLEQVRSICGTTGFDNGKIRDVIFIAMPKMESESNLTRSSLSLGTKDTVVYLAMLLNLGQKFDVINQATGGAALAAGWQKTLQALAQSGVTADEWKAAFGLEVGTLIEWPATARWPWLFVTFPVQDMTKAGKIVETLTKSDGAPWTQTEKDGVRYFSMQTGGGFLAITPTIALSNRIMIAGADPISVEAAVKRSESTTSELLSSATYNDAARLVPAPTNFFAYIDTALLYTRLDAAVRPILVMGAAFMPSVSDQVDLGKFPAAEVITKHLSPIVSSQRYKGDGYLTESVGPITLNQSGIALIVASATLYRKGAAGLSALGVPPGLAPQGASPAPSGGGKGFSITPTPPAVSPSPSGTP